MKRPKHYISEYSNLLNEWNWGKNKNLSPEAIGTGSTKKIWWKCHFVDTSRKQHLIHQIERRVRKKDALYAKEKLFGLVIMI